MEKSEHSKSSRKKMGIDYLVRPGYGTIYARTDWVRRVDMIKKLSKNRKKRSKVDKWRFKSLKKRRLVKSRQKF
ncbi:MAG: hypothetical protein ACFFEM_00805 [Candidatus Thorarchaeota archaeon]